MGKVHFRKEALLEKSELPGVHLALEYGVLHPLAEILAGLGHTAQAALASFGGGGDIVGDEDVHRERC
jgi:hypothetical protein